jgi:hypothetical protein
VSDETRVCGWCGKEILTMAIAGHLMDHAIKELIPVDRKLDPNIDDAQFYDYLCTQYEDQDLIDNFHKKEFLKDLFEDFKIIRRKSIKRYPPFKMSLLYSERDGFAIQVGNNIKVIPNGMNRNKALDLFASRINQRIAILGRKKDPKAVIKIDKIMDNCNLNSHHAKVPMSWKGIPVDVVRSSKKLYTGLPVRCGNSVHVTVPHQMKIGNDPIYIRLAKVLIRKDETHA